MAYTAAICGLASLDARNGAHRRHSGYAGGRNSDALHESEISADVWLVSELPIQALPPVFVSNVQRSQYLMVIEEHVRAGSFGQMLAHQLLLTGTAPGRFMHRTALGYVSGRYGSQRFHRAECGWTRLAS